MAGAEGVARLLADLRSELVEGLQLAGYADVDDVDADLVAGA